MGVGTSDPAAQSLDSRDVGCWCRLLEILDGPDDSGTLAFAKRLAFLSRTDRMPFAKPALLLVLAGAAVPGNERAT